MKRDQNQHGFTAMQIVLAIVALAIVGFTGWFVWHSKQAADNNYTSNPSSGASVSSVKSFAACKQAAGSIMQETYPEVCVTKSGQRLVDPSQSVQAP